MLYATPHATNDFLESTDLGKSFIGKLFGHSFALFFCSAMHGAPVSDRVEFPLPPLRILRSRRLELEIGVHSAGCIAHRLWLDFG